MPLWGASDAVEDKPKHFTDAEKLNVFATNEGWVKKTTGTGGRAGRVFEEVIVAIGGLSTSLNLADITAIDWNIDEFDKSDGGTLSVTVTFNEEVEVALDGGTPHLAVTGVAHTIFCMLVVLARTDLHLNLLLLLLMPQQTQMMFFQLPQTLLP